MWQVVCKKCAVITLFPRQISAAAIVLVSERGKPHPPRSIITRVTGRRYACCENISKIMQRQSWYLGNAERQKSQQQKEACSGDKVKFVCVVRPKHLRKPAKKNKEERHGRPP